MAGVNANALYIPAYGPLTRSVTSMATRGMTPIPPVPPPESKKEWSPKISKPKDDIQEIQELPAIPDIHDIQGLTEGQTVSVNKAAQFFERKIQGETGSERDQIGADNLTRDEIVPVS